MISEFEQGYLRGTSRRSNSVSELSGGEFDLLVLFQSWDSRLHVHKSGRGASGQCFDRGVLRESGGVRSEGSARRDRL